MNWIIFGRIADILTIIAFVISLGIFRKIYERTEIQKETYNAERQDLLKHLMALQQNIWNDGLTSPKLQDMLHTKVFEYQIKYCFISSPRCIFHSFRCTHLLKTGMNESNTLKIRHDINFLVARLSKKE